MFCPNCKHDLGSLVAHFARLLSGPPAAKTERASRARMVSDETVVAMRADFLQGELTQAEIAAKHGVNQITATRLILGGEKHRPELPNPVRKMREEYARGGISIGQLAERYGVSPRIASRHVRHLTVPKRLGITKS